MSIEVESLTTQFSHREHAPLCRVGAADNENPAITAGFSAFNKGYHTFVAAFFPNIQQNRLEVPVRPDLNVIARPVRTSEVKVGIVSDSLGQAVLNGLLYIVRNIASQSPLPQRRIGDLR